MNRCFQNLADRIEIVELLLGHEGIAFGSTGNAREDLLGITAVHPMRENAVDALLARCGATRDVLRRLLEEGELVETAYRGTRFCVRRPRREQNDGGTG